ncbi:MAG: ATP-dependent helicase [Bryobacterales bacterium]|nr:ATP-dependent helicase [Bryobacterales bacterium]MDE0436659.1 ATP-dependent helicase [Bryobacterales bacterium]
MNQELFHATPQQRDIIRHEGSAFIRACPGAGKTRVMAERARRLFGDMPPGRGIAFLSFTQAAVFELDMRLRREGILISPVFPSFIGTFDSFVWHFLIAPFGIKDSNIPPRLIADIDDFLLAPFKSAHPLPLSCFDPLTNRIIPDAAMLRRFDVAKKSPNQVRAYETSARRLRSGLRERGLLGFDEARREALDRLNEAALSQRIANALAGRFRDVIVDEAQDCNPDDLTIISWLRSIGVPVKVVCDPHQSIYGFRGGVTDHLFAFADTFSSHERKELTGNFRSSPNICKTLVQLRPIAARDVFDEPLGPLRKELAPVHVFSYSGAAVPASIGAKFSALLAQSGIDNSNSPVLAATKASSAAAVGQPKPSGRQDRAVRLAEAVVGFHFASGFNDVKGALESVHKIVLDLEGRLSGTSYREYLSVNDIDPVSWRPRIIALLRELKYDAMKYPNAKAWHAAAKGIIEKEVTISGGQTVSQKLRWNAAIETALCVASSNAVLPRTIHSVKGMEFPAVCVVTTTSTLKGILSFLETGSPVERAEDARKLYVSASRAQRMLVFAAPKSQAERLRKHLSGQGAEVTIEEI